MCVLRILVDVRFFVRKYDVQFVPCYMDALSFVDIGSALRGVRVDFIAQKTRSVA